MWIFIFPSVILKHTHTHTYEYTYIENIYYDLWLFYCNFAYYNKPAGAYIPIKIQHRIYIRCNTWCTWEVKFYYIFTPFFWKPWSLYLLHCRYVCLFYNQIQKILKMSKKKKQYTHTTFNVIPSGAFFNWLNYKFVYAWILMGYDPLKMLLYIKLKLNCVNCFNGNYVAVYIISHCILYIIIISC